ncbi:class I SAM-dependent methyltransferase [Candidatus Nitrospira neomarina]|uniref:Class I SAM-dependent methyltransferase n=1 Tax=Candidatus Nitrospira neomarina TaxID=3020899 RepID=A0AA96JVW1_9BACT|nr:class I SAM-dependent methyltransferase [Candidatus Nitrospira neomarina]WNM61873.1 class I SAM-dependent methyltransferase [Candidatus Nitrospira neomarina]
MSIQAPISRRTAIKYLLAALAAMAGSSSLGWELRRSSFLSPLWQLADLANASTTPALSTAASPPGQKAAIPRSNFHAVYDDLQARDRFYLFLQNIYHLYPESRFHQLIIDLTSEFSSDQEIYVNLQKRLSSIKPFLSEATYGLPALRKQKAEMASETAALLGSTKAWSGYVEIGTTGRYANGIRAKIPIHGPMYFVNDLEPSYSPNDIVERGQLTKLGEYVAMGNYEPFNGNSIPDESVDLVINFIGFHHAPADKRARFVQSVWEVLRPGGRLVVRDHDVDSPETDAFVALAHDVFNAGLGIPWEENAGQVRNFTSVPQLEEVLSAAGFEKTNSRQLQAHDPTINTLMVFVKPTVRAR